MAITLQALKQLLRARVHEAGGIRALGRAFSIQPSRISDALKDGVEPQPHVVEMLGYRKAQAKYERVER